MHKTTIEVGTGDLAQRIGRALSELVEPLPAAWTVFETATGWRVEAYYEPAPDAGRLADDLGRALGARPPALAVASVPDQNWVALSQAMLPPVVVGRFVIHGCHDRQRIARGPRAIEIEAGEAFGTAHHATTRGCLLAVERLVRRHRFARVLDLGCGSGVLAIAIARALPATRIDAGDVDARAVEIASANARLNGVGRRVTVSRADGLKHPRLRRPRRFDLIVANLTAELLIGLGPALAHASRPRGIVVLSGLLEAQAAQVRAACRARGFALLAQRQDAGWSTLTLIKRRGRPRRAA